MATYQDLFNETTFSGDNVNIDYLTVNTQATFPFLNGNSLISVDANGNLVSLPLLLDGQILIGRTGSTPTAGYITGTANQVTVTTGPGSIQLATPQDIATTSSPTFSTITASSLTPSYPVRTNGSNALTSGLIDLTLDVTSTLPIALGGTNSATALAGGNLMVSSGGAIVEGTSSTSPSFSGTITAGNIIDSGLTPSQPVHTNGTGQLISGLVSLTSDVSGALPIASGGTDSTTALTNGKIMVSSGGKIVEGTSSTAPSFTNVTVSSLTASQPVFSGTSGLLTSSGSVSLTSNVSGVLPIAMGGTNNPTALTNGNIMISNNGHIIEGTSLTSPSFTGLVTAGNLAVTSLTTSKPVYSNASRELINSQVALGTDVSGVLPIASGGSNSSTALTNGCIMVSSGGKIIEGMSSTSPIFQGSLIMNGIQPQLVFAYNGGNQYQIQCTAPPATSRAYGLVDVGNNAVFIMSQGTQTLAGPTTFGSTVYVGDANYMFDIGGTIAGDPEIVFDSTDVLLYDRSSNLFNFRIGGSSQVSINSTGLSAKTLAATASSNQLSIGGSNIYTITATPASTVTYTIPELGANGSFVMTTGTSTISTAFTGAIPSTSVNITYLQQGTQVTMYFGGSATVSATSTTSIGSTAAVPSALRPASDFYYIPNVQTATGSYANGLVVIGANGNITFYSTGSQGNFTSGNVIQLRPFSTTWLT